MTWKLTGIYWSAAYKLFYAALHIRKPVFKVAKDFFNYLKKRSYISLDSTIVWLEPSPLYPSLPQIWSLVTSVDNTIANATRRIHTQFSALMEGNRAMASQGSHSSASVCERWRRGEVQKVGMQLEAPHFRY